MYPPPNPCSCHSQCPFRSIPYTGVTVCWFGFHLFLFTFCYPQLPNQTISFGRVSFSTPLDLCGLMSGILTRPLGPEFSGRKEGAGSSCSTLMISSDGQKMPIPLVSTYESRSDRIYPYIYKAVSAVEFSMRYIQVRRWFLEGGPTARRSIIYQKVLYQCSQVFKVGHNGPPRFLIMK